MTIPAREAFQAAEKAEVIRGAYYFATPPKDVACVMAPDLDNPKYKSLAFRLESEPPFPDEEPNTHDMWTQVMFTPCPKCGAALVWYEAAYVPGYRVCAGAKHHHYLVG